MESSGVVNEHGPFELGVPAGVRVEVDTDQPETEHPGSDGEHDIFLPIITSGATLGSRTGQVYARSAAGPETDGAAVRPLVETAQPSTQPAAGHAHEEGTIFLPAVVRGAVQMR